MGHNLEEKPTVDSLEYDQSLSIPSSHFPLGDMISLMTTSLGAIRTLSVSLPLLDNCGIGNTSYLPNLELLRQEIDYNLSN